MLDKNGIEIKTGDVVEIKNAYFKNDNGLYFVEHSPEEVGWCGNDYSLRRIKKNGQLSTAKANICFWPIAVFVSDRMKRAEANTWNKEHATIEIRTDIDRQEIAKHFLEEAEQMTPNIERMSWNFGEDCQCVKDQIRIQEHLKSIYDKLTA